ncbi:MAG: hypothetical protein RIG61_06495 [Deltaproteobacteria bacterium]
MRNRLAVGALLIALFFGAALDDRAHARTSVSFDLFFDSLAVYGNWVDVPDYGYAWYPAQADPYWKPYTDGRWEWSDQGWLWVSYEPWGWATYHYGRWIFDDYYGWVWIPGTAWAPAWVSWYQSPGYVGWSPLPPDNNFFLEIGISFINYGYGGYYYGRNHHHHHHDRHHYYDNDYYPRRDHYVFVPEHKFTHKNARLAALEGPHDLTVIRNVKNVTNIKVVNNKVINYGPDRSHIERTTNRKLNKLNLVDRDLTVVRGKKDVNTVKGNSYNVYRPKVEKRKGETPFDRGYSGNKNTGVRETRALRPKVSDKNSNSGVGRVNKSLNSGPVRERRETLNRNNSRYSNHKNDYGTIREQKVNRKPVLDRKTERNTRYQGNTAHPSRQIRTRANGPSYKPGNNGANYAEKAYQSRKPPEMNPVNVRARRTETRPVRQTVDRNSAGKNQQNARNNYKNGPGNKIKAQNRAPRKQQNNYKSARNNNPAYRSNPKNNNAQAKNVNREAQRGGPHKYNNKGTKATNNNYSNVKTRGRAASPRSFNNKSYVTSSGRR